VENVTSSPGAIVTIAQHFKARGESSNAMLDLLVSGMANVADAVGGWFGADDRLGAGQAPP